MCKAFVIRRASDYDKALMAAQVEQMNADLCDPSPWETCSFELCGLSVIETVADSRTGETYSTDNYHFVKCECGAVHYAHGYEEDDFVCDECGEIMDVRFRLNGKTF